MINGARSNQSAPCLKPPFLPNLPPIVIWLLKKEIDPFVDDQGKEALNFQISITIIGIVCALLIFVGIGLILLVLLGLFWLIFTIIATIKANSGVAYRYPFTIRLIK
jgi:uncharacterized Tic20 family protein